MIRAIYEEKGVELLELNSFLRDATVQAGKFLMGSQVFFLSENISANSVILVRSAGIRFE